MAAFAHREYRRSGNGVKRGEEAPICHGAANMATDVDDVPRGDMCLLRAYRGNRAAKPHFRDILIRYVLLDNSATK